MVEPLQEGAIAGLEHVQVDDMDRAHDFSVGDRIDRQPALGQSLIDCALFEQTKTVGSRGWTRGMREPWHQNKNDQRGAERTHRQSL